MRVTDQTTIVNRAEAAIAEFVGEFKVVGCVLKLHVGEDWDSKEEPITIRILFIQVVIG